MTIEIHQPRLEALIQQRMASGRFQTIEEVLMQALENAPFPAASAERVSATGADLIEAMQAMPYKEELDFEHSRPHLPVRDVTL